MSDSLFESEWTFVTPRTRLRDAYNPGASATTSVTKNSQGVILNSMTDEDTRSEFSDTTQIKPADSGSSHIMPEIGMEESICVVETPANEEKSEAALSKRARSTSVDDVVLVASTLELHQQILPEVENEATANANTASGAITAVHPLKLTIGAENNSICIPGHPPVDEEEGSTTPRPNRAQSPGVFDAVHDTHDLEACKNARLEAEDSITPEYTHSIGATYTNHRTSGTSTMAASMCAVGIAQSRPNTGSALHGNLPNTMAVGTVVDLHSCGNQEGQHFEEEIHKAGYPAGRPRLPGYLARIRLHPVLLNYLRLNPLRRLAAEVLGHLRSNSHRVLIALLLLFLPLLVQYISDYVEKVQKNRDVPF